MRPAGNDKLIHAILTLSLDPPGGLTCDWWAAVYFHFHFHHILKLRLEAGQRDDLRFLPTVGKGCHMGPRRDPAGHRIPGVRGIEGGAGGAWRRFDARLRRGRARKAASGGLAGPRAAKGFIGCSVFW